MLRKRIGFILLVLAVLLAAAAPVLAQNLQFSVEREEVNLIVNDDGTVTITYLYTFVNSAGGSPIDRWGSGSSLDEARGGGIVGVAR